MVGFINQMEDIDIIKWYDGVGLDFYCCCHLRFSCMLTLTEKHEATFTKDLKVSDADGTEQVYFPSERAL